MGIVKIQSDFSHGKVYFKISYDDKYTENRDLIEGLTDLNLSEEKIDDVVKIFKGNLIIKREFKV